MAEAQPQRHIEEHLTPEGLSRSQLCVSIAMAVVGVVLIALGIVLHLQLSLRILLMLIGGVMALAGFLRASGATHIGVSTSPEGMKAGAEYVQGYARTLDVTDSLVQGVIPAKDGVMPAKQGIMPPKDGEIPGSQDAARTSDETG